MDDLWFDTDECIAAGALPSRGVRVRVPTDDPERTVFRSDAAYLLVPKLELANPARSARLCTVRTLLAELRDGVRAGLELGGLAGSQRGASVLAELDALVSGGSELLVELEDPAGLSRVEGVAGAAFERSWAQDEELGLLHERRVARAPAMETRRGLARLLCGARRVVALTGAGVSAESGIAPFRAGAGDGVAEADTLWARFDPTEMVLARIREEPAVRAAHWAMEREMMAAADAARPNGAHRFLAQLHAAGRLRGVVTQNIDRLHLRAGLPAEALVELHGHLDGTRCVECGAEEDCRAAARAAAARGGGECAACGGALKAATCAFGEALDPALLRAAREMVEGCDLLLLMGSSMLVEPANTLPALALRGGAPLAIVNLGPTKYDPFAAALVREPCGAVLSSLSSLVCGGGDELAGAAGLWWALSCSSSG